MQLNKVTKYPVESTLEGLDLHLADCNRRGWKLINSYVNNCNHIMFWELDKQHVNPFSLDEFL